MGKLSALPQDTSPTGDDYTVTVDTGSGQTKKVLLSDLLTYINASGTPTTTRISSPYKFYAYRSGAWTSSAVAAKVQYETEIYDTGSNFDTTLNRFTAPVAGFYNFSAAVGVAAAGANQGFVLTLYKNGAGLIQLISTLATSGWGPQYSGPAPPILLAIGDYVEIYHSFGGATAGTTGSSATWFSGDLASAT